MGDDEAIERAAMIANKQFLEALRRIDDRYGGPMLAGVLIARTIQTNEVAE